MATPAQAAANRANAQKSTGPRTEAGKSISSRNAITHGLCCVVSCLSTEDPDEAKKLISDLLNEHQPQSPTEQILVYKMADQFLLLKRAAGYLARHTAGNESIGGQDKEARQLSVYLRYYMSADRAFNRNLHDLLKLQKERRAAERELEAEIGFVSQAAEPLPEPATLITEKPPFVPPAEPVSPLPGIVMPAFAVSEPQKQAA